MNNFITIAEKAKEASRKTAALSTDIKNRALLAIADGLEQNRTAIFKANAEDLTAAKPLLETGDITKSVFNRLKLDENKMRDMIRGVRDVAKLDDPVNRVLLKRELDDGLLLQKVSCPIGVLGIIFEARPDVIVQISSLAIKSANAVILKGGKEAVNTNKTLLSVINSALQKIDGFPMDAIQQVFTRDDVAAMLQCDRYIDLLIPRGGNSLVQFIKENTKIPVLGHAAGVCHIFIDESADPDMSIRIVIDAKTQYPSACNAVETLLIHKNFLEKEKLLAALRAAGIKLIDDPDDWSFEYGDLTLAFKIVNGVGEAVEHINRYGSGHTDSVITEDSASADKFMNEVDSAGVYRNVSTRFADGFRYGFGAEVGISTNKTHARGPVGLDGLTIYKYKLVGDGHIVAEYMDGTRSFHHRDLKI